MIETQTSGRIVMVSSTLGLLGMIGYSQYAPTKYAIRGLAESLRQELLPHNIKVHVYFVATIDSPGNIEENKTKPEITKLLEEADMTNSSPAERARILIAGLERGLFAISSDWLTELFRCTGKGAAPGNDCILDFLLNIVGQIALPIWRRFADRQVLRHRERKNK